MKTATSGFALILSMVVPALRAADAVSVPPPDQVVAKMMERDAERQAALAGYTALRRYTLDNKSRHASMLVRVTVQADGSKQFAILEETGSSAVRKHVFHKILSEESEASRPNLRDHARITPANYSFRDAGMEIINGRAAYALNVVPRSESKYLIAGRIWIDSEDYAMLRVDGKPAKSPSFWTKSVHFVHTYQKAGVFWFPALNQSVTDARIFGRTDMSIEYFDYVPNETVAASSAPKSLTQ